MIITKIAFTLLLTISSFVHAYQTTYRCNLDYTSYESSTNNEPDDSNTHVPCYPWYVGDVENNLYHGEGTLYINPNLKFEGTFRYGRPYLGQYVESLWQCTATNNYKFYYHTGYNLELSQRVAVNRCKNDNNYESFQCTVSCQNKIKITSFNFETENILFDQNFKQFSH